MQVLRLSFILLFSLMANLSFAAPNFPELTGRVVDQVGLLSADKKQHIIANIKEFETKSSAQIAVAIVASLEGLEIRDYGLQLARHWALGQKDVNNGVLLLVAPNERKVSIEVGYGLEGDLPDALASSIIQSIILPFFKSGKMGRGIELGVSSIVKSLNGQMNIQNLQVRTKDDIDAEKLVKEYIGYGVIVVLFIMLIFIIFDVVYLRHRRGNGDEGGQTSGKYSYSGSYGGGFSGGGGSFGGGGASGGW